MTKWRAKQVGDTILGSIWTERVHPTKGRQRKTPSHEERFSTSISRTRREVKEIALCNHWSFFGTITFAPQMAQDSEPFALVETVKNCIDEMNHGLSTPMKYLLVPECYDDHRERIHIHALFENVPEGFLESFATKVGKKPSYVYRKMKAGKNVYAMPELEKRYGFTVVIGIDNIETVIGYMGKSLSTAYTYCPKGCHLFRASRGLKRAEVLGEGYCSVENQKKMEQLAGETYYHRAAPGGTIYGETCICRDSPQATALIAKMMAEDNGGAAKNKKNA
ncbi:MAG: hypothetical protein LKJ90_08490 [Faecalibacterium sp.]|nr:hypothetical protein [Faecalibacterium sp.]